MTLQSLFTIYNIKQTNILVVKITQKMFFSNISEISSQSSERTVAGRQN